MVETVVVKSTRIASKRATTTTIDSKKTVRSSARPTLDAALQRENGLQVVVTPLKNTNISLDGLSGERVSVVSNLDPILGRIDGAIDARTVFLNPQGSVKVLRGIDSLPYGSQNIAGVVSLEPNWIEQDQTFGAMRFGSLGGVNSNLTLGSDNRWDQRAVGFDINFSREPARYGENTVDTLVDSTQRYSGHLVAEERSLGVFAGRPLDLRMGIDGFAQGTEGVFAGDLTESRVNRLKVFSDLRFEPSVFHISFSRYSNNASGLKDFDGSIRQERFVESLWRLGPQIEERIGSTTLLGGVMLDVRATESSRSSKAQIDQLNVGAHLGARYSIDENWLVGIGGRYDSSPNLFSPKIETKYLFDSTWGEHAVSLESTYGFREPTAKEHYLNFVNSSLRYQVLGNERLGVERSFQTALRYSVESRRWRGASALYGIWLRDTIGFQTLPRGRPRDPLTMTYQNQGLARTFGFQQSLEYDVANKNWLAFKYQWLDGKNLSTGDALFLQPTHRVALGLSHYVPHSMGFDYSSDFIYTSRQNFFDLNRNGRTDDDFANAFWMVSAELGYRFRADREPLRLFVRVENALNSFDENTFPIERRNIIGGMSFGL